MMHAAPCLLTDLVRQIIHRKERKGHPDERRRERAESILILLLEGNRSNTQIINALGVAHKTIADAVQILLDEGYAYTWLHSQGRPSRWFGLTRRGLARAKMLKEMQ